MGSVGEEDEEESTCLPDEFPRKNNVNGIHRRGGESGFLIMYHRIQIRAIDKAPKDYKMTFYMITNDSTAVCTFPYIDHVDEYSTVVYEGFPKIQTIKGFTRFCGWLESGRPKTFKLKELEYITQTLNKSERFLKWSNDPSKGIVDIVSATDRQIIILKNATKEKMEVQCGKSHLSKDEVSLDPQQMIVLLGGEICRIV